MPCTPVAEIVRRLTWGMGACLLVSAAAAAESQGGEPQEVEEVTVTGSRVRGAEPVGATVTTLDRSVITSSTQPTVDRILKELPQNFDLGVSENSRGQSGGAANIVYGNSVNLRGIGPYATLVLLDGHRVTNNSRSTDPSILPTLALERIEVIADGASAIYGSDAVAGVVNLIPRRTLDGVEVFARGGFAEQGNFAESAVGAAWGKVWDRGQAMLAFEHVERDNLSGDDRDFFVSDQRAFGGRDHRVTRCDPGTLRIGNTTYAMPEGGLTPANVGSLVAGTSNLCNSNPGQDLFPEQRYNSFASTLSFDFTDRVTLRGDAFYSKRDLLRNPPHTNGTLVVPETNAWFVRPAGFTGTSYQIDYSFENDLPLNSTRGGQETWQITPSLLVKLGRDWQLEALVGRGATKDRANQTRGLNNTALNAALASSDPATAFDPYGLGRTSDAVLAAISDQIFLAPTDQRFLGYELRVNGSLATLPGGNLGVAAGFERQEIDVDIGTARGGPTAPLVSNSYSREVDSAYVEVQVPIFGPGNERPGLARLTATGAARYDDYSDVGDTTNIKFGLTWKPVTQLGIRASYGTSFRAPLITQVYGNSNTLGVSTYQNPAGGPPLQGVSRVGPNLDLTPEKATTWSAGLDWDATSDLRFSLTYFDVNYRGQIESPSGANALAREADFAGMNIVLRGAEARAAVLAALASGAAPPAAPYPGGSIDGVDLFIDIRNFNLGVSNTRGLDFQGQYTFDAGSVGEFRFSSNATYLTHYDVSLTRNAPVVDRLNTIFYPLRLKMRNSLQWQKGPVQALLSATYVNGYENNAVTPTEDVDSYMPVDLSIGVYPAASSANPLLNSLRVGLDVRNLFDEEPPFVNIAPNLNGSGGYDATVANPIGRLFGVNVRATW
jgi:iron complex outermembrane receptor protein